MGSSERREREKKELRGKILEATRDLFSREGYDAVTLRKIAKKIEYSATAIYLHFADKASILRELCVSDFLVLARGFGRIAAIPDPLERLRRAGRAYAAFAIEHPNQYRFMFMTPPLAAESPEIHAIRDEMNALPWRGDPTLDAYAFLRVSVVEALEKGLLREDLTDADLVAQALWSAVHGVVALHLAKEHDVWIKWRPVKKRVDLVIDALVRGLAREA